MYIAGGFVELDSSMPHHVKFQGLLTLGSKNEDFKGFYHIWTLWLSRTCDQDHLSDFFKKKRQFPFLIYFSYFKCF